MSYVRYGHGSPPPRGAGWDAWADDYAELGWSNPIYALGKDLLHETVDEIVPQPPSSPVRVLDFHCGAGDDLARFLARGWHTVGCDGSVGMLDAAARRCSAALASGQLELWYGPADELGPGSLGAQPFDLVWSTTGGFAYVEDDEFVRLHRVLVSMLAPGGVMVIAHLTPFCAADALYHVLHGRLRRAVQRWRRRVPITVRGEPLLMRLRSARHVRRLLRRVVRLDRVEPLLWCCPPFQSGFAPGPRTLALLGAIERSTRRIGALSVLADQVVCVARAFESSANSAR